jgi:DnaJ-class molecular chaperone
MLRRQTVSDRVKCLRCGGSGEIRTDRFQGWYGTCPTCQGDGTVPAIEDEQTIDKVQDAMDEEEDEDDE